MDEATKAAWRDATRAIFARTSGPSDGGPAPLPVGLNRIIGNASHDVDRWHGAVRRAQVDHYVYGNGMGFGPFRIHAMKAVRMGYAAATGEWSAVSSAEADQLSGMDVPGVRVARRPDPPATVPDGERFHVEYAFAYRGTRPGTRKSCHAVGRGTVVVERVEEGVTAPAWSLPIPGTETSLVVREYRGDLFRPVLRPGSWDVATESDFVRACEGNEPWKDDPFGEKRPGSPLAPREYADEVPFSRPSDERACEAARAEAETRAGTLLSIGGVLHRRTDEPALTLATFGQSVKEYRLGWRVAGLDFFDDQRALVDPRTAMTTDASCGYGDGIERTLPGLPATVPDAALRIVETLAASTGRVSHVFPEALSARPPTDLLRELAKRMRTIPEADPIERMGVDPAFDPYAPVARRVADMVLAGDVEGAARYVAEIGNPTGEVRFEDRFLRVAMTKAMLGMAVVLVADPPPPVECLGPESEGNGDEDVVASMAF